MNMQDIQIFLSNYSYEFFLGVLMLNFLLFICILAQAIKIKNISGKYRQFMKGAEGRSLEEHVKQMITANENNRAELEQIKKELNSTKQAIKNNLQRVGVVRYNSFSDIGSDLSYAVAILDGHGNGVVMSSIYGRDDFRAFAKPVTGGSSKYRLSKEEQEAINIALKKA